MVQAASPAVDKARVYPETLLVIDRSMDCQRTLVCSDFIKDACAAPCDGIKILGGPHLNCYRVV